jgi:hypothetical protein
MEGFFSDGWSAWCCQSRHAGISEFGESIGAVRCSCAGYSILEAIRTDRRLRVEKPRRHLL